VMGYASCSSTRRLPLHLAFVDCAAVVLCRVILVFALDEDECKIYEIGNGTCIRGPSSVGVSGSDGGLRATSCPRGCRALPISRSR